MIYLEEFIEAGKEGLRVTLIAAVPILIDGVGKGVVDWKLVGMAAIVAALRFIDSWLHTSGVAEKGLTRF